MQVASKRQRLEEPPRKPRSPISEERQRQYNCSSCGGSRLAGMGGPYKLREDREASVVAMAKRTQACWMDREKGLVATKCGLCKKLIVPTDEQFKIMAMGHTIPEAAQLIATGWTADDLAAVAK